MGTNNFPVSRHEILCGRHVVAIQMTPVSLKILPHESLDVFQVHHIYAFHDGVFEISLFLVFEKPIADGVKYSSKAAVQSLRCGPIGGLRSAPVVFLQHFPDRAAHKIGRRHGIRHNNPLKMMNIISATNIQ